MLGPLNDIFGDHLGEEAALRILPSLKGVYLRIYGTDVSLDSRISTTV